MNLLLLALCFPAFAGECDESLLQDLNCNTKDVSVEAPVDMTDPPNRTEIKRSKAKMIASVEDFLRSFITSTADIPARKPASGAGGSRRQAHPRAAARQDRAALAAIVSRPHGRDQRRHGPRDLRAARCPSFVRPA